MSHLSEAMLELQAAGVASPEAQLHLERCEHCGARLQQVAADLQRIRAMPEFAAAREALAVPSSGGWSRKTWGVGVVLALAASLLVFAILPPRPSETLKGGPILKVTKLNGDDAPLPLRVGDKVALTVRSSRARFALVMAVGPSGALTQVWPTDRARSGEIKPATTVALSPALEVTPGDAGLIVFFSAEALPAEEVTAEISPVPAIRGDPGWGGRVPKVRGELERAWGYFEVRP